MMLRGELTILGVEQQVALTAWIVKMMMVYNHIHDATTPDRLVFSAEQRLQFRDTFEPPTGVAVAIWLAHFVGARPNESAPIFGVLQGYDEARQDMRGVRTFVFSFAVGQFAVQMLAVQRTEDSPSFARLMSLFCAQRSPASAASWTPSSGRTSENTQVPGGRLQSHVREGLSTALLLDAVPEAH